MPFDCTSSCSLLFFYFYLNDQSLRQAKTMQKKVKNMSDDLTSISIEQSKKAADDKRKKLQDRTQFYKIYKRKCRQKSAFKAKEIIFQRESKQSARKDPLFKTKERESKQSTRKDPAYKTKERESKQSERSNPIFRAKETVYQKESKQSARKDPLFKTKERESKQSVRKDPAFKTKERESKQSERRNPIFRAKQTVYQKDSKQSRRKDPVFKRKERESKQSVRANPVFKAKEIVYQNTSKKKARETPYAVECERIKKQQIRQEKRKHNDDSEINVPRKKCKRDTDTLPKSHQKDFKSIEESIKQFHLDISIGPLYVCSCCHQTWFRKSVSMLKNTHISAEIRRLHCTGFASVGNEEWVCHTCLSTLRERKTSEIICN